MAQTLAFLSILALLFHIIGIMRNTCESRHSPLPGLLGAFSGMWTPPPPFNFEDVFDIVSTQRREKKAKNMKILIITLALMLSGCSYMTHVAVGKYSAKHSISVATQF